MKVYHIEFAKTGIGMSGGENFMVEIIKELCLENVNNILLTTDNGQETYMQLGLVESNLFRYKVINSYKYEHRFGVVISYLLRSFQILRLINSLNLQPNDLVICHSEFLPNIVALALLRGKTKKILCMFHMLAPDLFRDTWARTHNSIKYRL